MGPERGTIGSYEFELTAESLVLAKHGRSRYAMAAFVPAAPLLGWGVMSPAVVPALLGLGLLAVGITGVALYAQGPRHVVIRPGLVTWDDREVPILEAVTVKVTMTTQRSRQRAWHVWNLVIDSRGTRFEVALCGTETPTMPPHVERISRHVTKLLNAAG